jgi:endonuclease-3
MPATTNKQKVLNQLMGRVDKAADSPEEFPVLEQFAYAICREGATKQQADKAYQSLKDRFYDWNEIRVSSAREVEEVLDPLAQSNLRAERLISFLQEVFETTFSFDLEALRKKGLKQAAKHLSRFQAANDYVVAWVTQKSLGGHAIPLDKEGLRLCQRLHLIDEDISDPETARTGLEHQVPKARGAGFIDSLSDIAGDYCWEEDPKCPA